MQLYLIIAAAFLIWSGAITTTAYLKGSAHGMVVTAKVCADKIKVQDDAIIKQKEEAAKIIAFETANVVATEKKLQETKNLQEVIDANNQKKISKLSNSVRLLTGAVGQLRDPYSRRGDGDCTPKSTTSPSSVNSADNGAGGDRFLSPEFTQFIQSTLDRADEINTAYKLCRDDSFSIRATVNIQEK